MPTTRPNVIIATQNSGTNQARPRISATAVVVIAGIGAVKVIREGQVLGITKEKQQRPDLGFEELARL